MKYIEQIQTFQPMNAQEKQDKSIVLEAAQKTPELLLTRSFEIAHITSSSLIMNASFSKALMVHHNIYKTWTWTGGHADGEKDLLVTALKEACEETGVQSIYPYREEIFSLDILPVYGHWKNGLYVSAHLHFNAAYLFIADETDPLLINDQENSAVAWIPWNEVPDYSNEPFMIDIFNKILQRR